MTKRVKKIENIRSRKWCIEVNPGASCYEDFENIVAQETNCQFYYILHDKDNDELPHYHLVINYKNAHFFNSLRLKYYGAHLETCNYLNLSIQYLIHKNNPEKYQYDVSSICTNDVFESVDFMLSTQDFEKLDTPSLLQSIASGEVYNITSACLKYGIGQVQSKRSLIKDLVNEFWSKNDIK